MEGKEINAAEALEAKFNEVSEAKANEAMENAVAKSNEALEAKANEINSEVETLKNQNVELQKEIDTMKENFKAPAVVKSLGSKNELKELVMEKADAISNLKKGDTVTLDLKTFASSAGAASAVYGDERVSEIKYDPNFSNRVRNHLLTGSTSQTGAIRHSFETAETDSSAPKVKGAAQAQSAVTLTDVHTPIQTLYNLLTLPQEWLDDVAMIESYLSTRLMANLMDVEDIQLLRGNGSSPNYSGLATGARNFADNAARESYVGSLADSFGTAANEYDVISAVAAGMANENFMADKVFINPIDYYSMVLVKSTQNEYVLQQTISPNGEYKTIWNGIEFIKTPAQTAGTFTLIDSKQATQYWMREGAQIEFGMNDNDFATNSVSVRASIRGALTNYKSNGIVSDTFANFFTALNA